MTKQKLPDPPPPDLVHDFKYIPNAIMTLLSDSDKTRFAARLYLYLWSPINFAIIALIGLIINAFTLTILRMIPFVSWFGVLVTWIWLWLNTVGPFGKVWGFRKSDATKK